MSGKKERSLHRTQTGSMDRHTGASSSELQSADPASHQQEDRTQGQLQAWTEEHDDVYRPAKDVGKVEQVVVHRVEDDHQESEGPDGQV